MQNLCVTQIHRWLAYAHVDPSQLMCDPFDLPPPHVNVYYRPVTLWSL